MGKLDIKESIEINTSAEKAWEIIGPKFLNIADWGMMDSKTPARRIEPPDNFLLLHGLTLL